MPKRPQAQLERWPVRIRELTLLRRAPVTPRMLRLTLGGPNHRGFESHIFDEHVKLLFPHGPEDLKRIPTQDGDRLRWPRPMVPSRDYTVRRYDPQAGEVDIDFVVHAGGMASTWAQEAEIGSTIWVAGPPRGIRIPDDFTWRAYLADETGIPAVARCLEELPAETEGIALIEVRDEDDVQQFHAPAGIEVRWLFRGPQEPGTTRLLAEAANRIHIPRGGGAYVWYGGEQGAIKPLRAWVKAAGLGQGEFDLTGYWRRGARGDQMNLHDVVDAVTYVLRNGTH
ncbi:MAG: siderophore-interacting protein [Ancrocorticia sp.]|jgi:NADPH-dependent ferric siderophore reductase|nr:siderophore-interacting protein [Ancrocorticia sp.]MCI2194397.1 siderophore-interacting protein [Ancrocorticia sp.]